MERCGPRAPHWVAGREEGEDAEAIRGDKRCAYDGKLGSSAAGTSGHRGGCAIEKMHSSQPQRGWARNAREGDKGYGGAGGAP